MGGGAHWVRASLLQKNLTSPTCETLSGPVACHSRLSLIFVPLPSRHLSRPVPPTRLLLIPPRLVRCLSHHALSSLSCSSDGVLIRPALPLSGRDSWESKNNNFHVFLFYFLKYYNWIGHGLQSGPTLAFLLWLSDFKTETSFEFLVKNQGLFFNFSISQKMSWYGQNRRFWRF